MAAPPDNTPSSLLFDLSPIEEDDPIDVEWRQAYAKLQEAFADRSEVEIQSWLQLNVSRDTQSYNETINGLLYMILVATSTPPPANTANSSHDNPGTITFRRIGFVTRDGLTFVVRQVRYFCNLPTFYKIRPPVREQIIWLVGQLAESRVAGTEFLFTSLLRQIRGGDISPSNVQLADSMLRMLEERIQFVYSYPVLIAHSCYSYLRLMLDHARFAGLRQREASYCGRLLRERFRECCEVGRDLIRAMQDVARIREIEEIWADLLHAPERLNPQLEGIHQIMATPSNTFYLTGRLTPDMEQKLLHILRYLNHGQHLWNLNKFIERFLSAPETDALYCDVVRYICGVYHPSNQVLASAIVPRFVLINDLFRSVKSNIAASNIKLALFYDWLFYDPARDNIMNIEPAALLLHDSALPSRAIHHRQPHMTAILVEFLQFTVDNYHPPMREFLQQHVGMAGQDIVDKGVIKSFGDVYRALAHEQYAPVREYLVTLFHPTMGNMGEGIPAPVGAGGQGVSGGAEPGSIDETIDEFETPSSYLDTSPDVTEDDEEELMVGGGVRRASSETPPPGMDVGDSPKQLSEHDEDMDDEEEDEIMETSTGPGTTASAPTSAKLVLDAASSSLLSDWTAGPSTPSQTTATVATGRTDHLPEDKPRSRQPSFAGPSASLWLFGSLPQDFKAAFEEDPKSDKTIDMFRRIWEVFGDEAGAGVDGAELAKEIGREIRVFAGQATIPETFISTKLRHQQPRQHQQQRGRGGAGVGSVDIALELQESRDLGPLEGLISCLWKITHREGPSGAMRVAHLFLQADSEVEHSDRLLSMWFLVGIVHGYQRSLDGDAALGDKDVSMASVLNVYRALLEEEAVATAATEGQQQSNSETDMDIDATESRPGSHPEQQQLLERVQSSLMRDLSLLQSRQLVVFDRVLPLVLEHLGDTVPRTLQFFKLVLALNVPSQLYSLSLGLVRKRFSLFATGSTLKERPFLTRKDSLANGTTSSVICSPNSSAMQHSDLPSSIPQDLIESFKETLGWETYEQVGLWQLFVSEFGSQPLAATRLFKTSWIGGLTFLEQGEALGGVLNMQQSLLAISPTLQLQLALLRAVAGQQQWYPDGNNNISSKGDQVSQDFRELCANVVEHWGRKHPRALQVALLHLCRGELAQYAAAEEEQASSSGGGASSSSAGPSSSGKKGKKASQALQQSMIQIESSGEFDLLKTALTLILLWWNSIAQSGSSNRDAEEAVFFAFWDSQIRSAVSSRLKDVQGPMELEQWPSAWWTIRRASSAAAAAATVGSGSKKLLKDVTMSSALDSASDDEEEAKDDPKNSHDDSESGRDGEEDEEEQSDNESDNSGEEEGTSSKNKKPGIVSVSKITNPKKKVAQQTSATASPRSRSSPRNQATRTMEGPKTTASTSSANAKGSGSNKSSTASSPTSRSNVKAKATTARTSRSNKASNNTASTRGTRSRRRNASEEEEEEEQEEEEEEEEEEERDNNMEEEDEESAASSAEKSDEDEGEGAKDDTDEDEDEEESDEAISKPTKGKAATRAAKSKTPPQRRRLTKAGSSIKTANSRAAASKAAAKNKKRKSGRGKDDESDYQETASEEEEEEDDDDAEEDEAGEEEDQASDSEEDTAVAKGKPKGKGKANSSNSKVRGGKKKNVNNNSDAMDEDDQEDKSEEDQSSQDEEEEEEENRSEEDDDQEDDDDDGPRSRARATRAGGAGSRSSTQRKGSNATTTAASRRATRAISSSPEAQSAKRRGKNKRRITDDEDGDSS